MHFDVTFPGGLAVVAHHRGFAIRTDQPVASGGEGSAPSPFDLFLASIATCAGLYALRFCQEREIATAGLVVRLAGEPGERGRVAALRIEVELPDAFPDRYREAIVRAIDHCSVKRHLLDPPRIEITVSEGIASTAR